MFVAESHLASSERWIKLAGCCWNAPDCLRNVKALRPHFETLEKLFHKILEVPNATSEDIATELVELDGDTSSIKQIKQLFMALSDGIKKTPSSYEFMHLTKQRIFPVQGKEGQTILTTATDARWFIPDRSSYKKTFGKVLHLFDFTLRELESLEPLLQKLGIVARKISRNVMEETVVKGRDSAILNAQYTEAYRTKAPYLLSWVLSKLSHIHVLTSISVLLESLRKIGYHVYYQASKCMERIRLQSAAPSGSPLSRSVEKMSAAVLSLKTA